MSKHSETVGFYATFFDATVASDFGWYIQVTRFFDGMYSYRINAIYWVFKRLSEARLRIICGKKGGGRLQFILVVLQYIWSN